MEGTLERMLLDSPAVKSAIARITEASVRYEESLRKQEEIVKRASMTKEQKEELARITVKDTSSSHSHKTLVAIYPHLRRSIKF